VIKVLDMAYEQRGKLQGLLFHPDQARNTATDNFAKGSGNIACARA
jgi:hypothetical protein